MKIVTTQGHEILVVENSAPESDELITRSWYEQQGGSPGKSAFDLAVEQGFSGDLASWLVSLKGDAGEDGSPGSPGATGSPGVTGAAGVSTFATGGNIGSAATSATTGTMTVSMTTSVITITPTGACTFNASGGVTGQLVTFAITTSGTSSFTLTWGTNFRKTGTLATGTTSARFFAVTFRCINGTIWQEISRTAAQT